MSDANTLLEAAGLSPAAIGAWRASAPERTADFEAASVATCAHLARGEELLGNLPPRPARSEAEARAAAVVSGALDDARAAFLRVTSRPSTTR